MARDKLITVRIEGEKRQAFGELAKSQNTDTASLLYDFINQCLSGQLDISLVTGKKQWIDKLDNQIGDDRIDKLETATQRLDERVGSIAKKLADWVEAFDDRLNDSNQGLSNKITSLEHRLNALSIQLDSQQLDRIDTDSQKDRQGENPDMGTVATVEAVDDTVETVDETDTSPLPNQETVEPNSSINEPVTGSIGPVRGDSIGKPCKGMNAADAYRYVTKKGVKVSQKTLSNWVKLKEIPITDKGDKVSEYLVLRGKLYYPSTD